MYIALSKIMHTKNDLLSLRRARNGAIHPIPSEPRKPFRGCRAGAKLKARRWKYKPFLPSVQIENVNFLNNKCNELLALVRYQRLNRECSLMCFTETRLNDNMPHSCMDLTGFSTVRADKDVKASGKSKDGG